MKLLARRGAIVFGLIGTMLIWAWVFLVEAQSFGSQVPANYYPDYQIAQDFQEMSEAFGVLDATIKLSEAPDPWMFAKLKRNFDTVFEFFPKDPQYLQVYTQCEIITSILALEYSNQYYAKFKSKCFEDIRSLVKEMNTKFKVKAVIKAKPTSWSLPLTVTFDARDTLDPSLDTIPSDNFFWYYKDVNGVEVPFEKNGPVVNHTFTAPGKHVVHLTARSSNNQEEWILDGSDTIEIDVAPQAADIVVFLWWRKLTEDTALRINTLDAKNGFLLDGSATTPTGERKILSHTWKIKSKQTQERVDITRENEWPPTQLSLSFPYNGIYSVSLEIVDNETNKVKKEFEVSVSDPVALLRHTPAKWNTSTDFTFDGSASYSISSRPAKHQWIVIDPNGDQIDTLDGKTLKRSFVLPGIYTIQLKVEDELGNESYDIKKLEVESTAPIPSFQILPLANREKPSQFVLDASGTYDEDVAQWVDTLKYGRSFSNPWVVTVDKTVETWEKIVVTFDEIGKHKVKLTVTDEYGKIEEVEKVIQVDSTLRPTLEANPVTAVWWDEIQFSSTANKEISWHQRDFGDGESTNTTTESTSKHQYDTSGVFPVKLSVATEDGEENSVTRNVFMWEKDTPVLAYEVRYGQDQFLSKQETCNVDGEEIPAYKVTREDQFQINLSESVNAKWQKQWLGFLISPEINDSGKLYEKNNLSYNFNELWCTYLELRVQDKQTAKEVVEKVYFVVENDLPELGNITISFPQAQSQSSSPAWGLWLNIWAGLQVSQTQQENLGLSVRDPLMVRVTATWVRDNDSQIKRYIWYYYNTKDPEEWEYTATTPASVPYYTFSVPRVSGDFAFGVVVEDTDGGKVDSDDVLGEWPSITFSQQGSPDLPLVDMDVSITEATVWEEVTFSFESEVISNRSDFDQKRFYKMDYDGDGFFESQPFKENEHTFSYSKPWEYKPQVKIVYRDRVGIDKWPTIVVRQWVKNSMYIDSFGTTALIKNTSTWEFELQKMCANVPDCGPWSEFVTTWSGDTQESVQLVEYPSAWTYELNLAWLDTLWNRPTTFTTTIDVQENDDPFHLLSYPAAIKSSLTWVHLTVGSQLNNEISFFPQYQSAWNCFIDLDLAVDSDGDEDPIFDQDVPCNELTNYTFNTTKPIQKWSIYFVYNGDLTSIPLQITLLDNASPIEAEITDEIRESYNRLEDLISDVENGVVPDDMYYGQLLENLRTSLVDGEDLSSVILQLHEYVNNSNLNLPDDHKDRLEILMLGLTDETLQAALGGTEYDTSKANILTWFSYSPTRKTELRWMFQELEANRGNKDAIKEQLNNIWTVTENEFKAGNIDEIDRNEVEIHACAIAFYYDVPTKRCGTDTNSDANWSTADDDGSESGSSDKSSSSGSSWWFSGIIKRVVIWVILLILIFVGIVILFAIKAKKQAGGLDEDDEEE